MQTFTQVFAGALTWQLNVPGNYFILLGATNPVNIRFYKQNKKLNLGDITSVLPGLEAGPFKDTKADGIAFDRIEIDTTAADTITLGIGDGSVRYNRSQGSVLVTSGLINVQGPRALANGPVLADQPVLSRDIGYVAGANYASGTLIAAGGTSQVFSAASNTNGAIVHAAQFYTNSAAQNNLALLAKATAPTTAIDGLLLSTIAMIAIATINGARLERARFIPAGLGLFFFASQLETAAGRLVDYTLL